MGFVPAATVAVGMGVRLPSAPIVYCEIPSLSKFAAEAYFPPGSTVTAWGYDPATTVAA
ncbi:MAG: hypothetical protein AABZ10_02165 [Nitrospirota bacterium]